MRQIKYILRLISLIFKLRNEHNKWKIKKALTELNERSIITSGADTEKMERSRPMMQVISYCTPFIFFIFSQWFLSHDASIWYHLGAMKIAWVTSSPNDIIQDKPIDLRCYFSGWPLPREVHWYKDGELISNGTEGIYHSEDEKEMNGENTLRSTLHLPPGREEQEGFYKCSARNSIPSSASFEIQMIYQCK